MGTPLHFSFSPPYNEADRRVGSFCAFSFTGSAQGEKLYVRKETLEAGCSFLYLSQSCEYFQLLRHVN